MAKTSNRRGGKRPGAGRPAKAETHATPIKDAEARIADRLPEILDTLFALARGGREVVEDKYEVNRDGDFVLSERKASKAGPDRTALIYLINRVMGPPLPRDNDGNAAQPARIIVEYADTEPKE